MRRRLLSLSAFLVLVATGCNPSGGNGGGDDDDDAATPLTVEDTLTLLGVDLAPSPRRSFDGTTDLPASFTPFGSHSEVNRIDELFTVNVPVLDPTNTLVTLAGGVHVLEKDVEASPASVLDTPADPVWFDENQASQAFSQSERAAAAADLDNDGREEVVVVYVDLANAAQDEEIHVMVKEDEGATTPFSQTDTLLKLQAGVRDVTVAAGDWNGDGFDDLAIGIDTVAEGAKLFFVENVAGVLTVNDAATKLFPAAVAGRLQTVQLASGRLDYDGGEELAAVVTEYITTPSGITTWYVFDDASAAYAQVGTSLVSAQDGGIFGLVVADVATGDVDGDFLDEVLIGGLRNYTANCDAVEYGAVVLQDVAHGLTVTGDQYDEIYGNLCDQANPWRERWVHVNAIDMDGDGKDEMQMNRQIFSSVAAAPFPIMQELGAGQLMPDSTTTYFDRSTSVMTVGDLSGDGRQDLIVYTQDMPEAGPAITAYGIHQIDGFGVRASILTEFQNTQTPLSPLIVPVNVDVDSAVLKFDAGTYALVFTEPVVLAALAAAPCQEGIGQSTDACGTTFGTATSSTTTVEDVLSVTASVSIGINIDGGVFTQSELSLKGTLSASASSMKGSSYTYTESVVYSTGPLEDSVIFTTIPYDTWTYTVVTHPDPAMVGEPYVVSMPRQPLTLIAEVGFFNASLRPSETPIGLETFSHVPGDIASYPTVAEKNAILAAAPNGGLQTPAQAVGQGTSTTEIGLAVGTEYTEGSTLELGFEFEMEATAATVMAGFSVGASTEHTLQVTSGTETSYTGVVSSIDAEHFADNVYSFGLFTYVFDQPATDRQFQVVNYWVE